MDRLIRFELEEEDEPRWLNVEVQASWKADVPARAFRFWSLASRRFSRLETLVICLRRGRKQGEPVAAYAIECGATRLRFEYRLVRLWDVEPLPTVE